MNELQLIAMFCDIDAFCKAFGPVYHRHLLPTSPRHRVRQPKLILSEVRPLMDWFYGFKLHLIVNDEGELLACQLTPGHVDDQQPVPTLTATLMGQLFGDQGYISQAWRAVLCAHGLSLLTKVRRNMKNRLMRLWDKLMLRKRALIETINDQLKNISRWRRRITKRRLDLFLEQLQLCCGRSDAGSLPLSAAFLE